MSLIGALDKTKHFDEFNSNLQTAEGNKTPAQRKAEALANLMSVEDGDASVGDVATPSTVAVEETFDGVSHITKLTCTDMVVMTTIGDNASLGGGALVYTLPAGDILIEQAVFTGTVNAEASVQSDTPDVGMGTVIGSGAVAVLGGTATFEDIVGGTAAASVDDGAVGSVGGIVANGSTLPLLIASASAHTIHMNAADGWADRDAGTVPLTFTGTISIKWRLL